MPQLLRRFIGKTCMNGGVVKPHLIENTNSYEYPRAGNEQTTGRQRVGIPLKSRLQNRETSQQRLVPRAKSHLFQGTVELVSSRRHCRLGLKLRKVRMGPRRHRASKVLSGT